MSPFWWYIVGFLMVAVSFFIPEHPASNADILAAVGILIVAMYRLTRNA